MKKLFVFLGSAILLGGAAQAQQAVHCHTDEVRAQLVKQYPQILLSEAKLEQEIQRFIANASMNSFAKGTDISDTFAMYHIPVVFHIVHDYGEEYVSDDQIFEVVNDMNRMYSRRNSDSVGITAPYAGNIRGTDTKYRGKANIQFHLATKDPLGNPTRGITRTRSYFANNAGDNSKIEQWAPDSYLNIWLIHTFSGSHTGAAAYAIKPGTADVYPWGDGVITIVQPSSGNGLNTDHTISHEVGHILNLDHPFGQTNNPGSAGCGDDGVDDTPPTKGHTNCSVASQNDTACATGYQKTYSKAQYMQLYGGDPNTLPASIIVDYPDTVNTQNMMDYSYCAKMMTHGQVVRMRAALNSGVGGRSKLITASNLLNTGVTNSNGDFNALPSLAPKADFSASRPFVCADGATPVTFTNRSWNDTITASSWTFGNGAAEPTSTSSTNVSQTFTTAGWVHASLTVTGNNNPTTGTINKDSIVYAADPVGITNKSYVQSFNAGADMNQWPIFNYYGGAFKWETVNNAGYNDNTAIRFANKETRPFYLPSTQTLSPDGTYSDFYSRAFDLTNASPDTKLSFAYAGAYRTTNPSEMNDKLQISYSVNCGQSWNVMSTLTKGTLANNGYVSNDFTPTYSGQWKWFGAPLTNVIGEDKVFFRFRYTVGTNNIYEQIGTGNNFYMDMIGVNDFALGVNPAQLDAAGIVLSPNPTSGAATVTIKGGDNTTAMVHVMDVTGKLVYSTEARLTAAATKVEIPAERISVKGLYMVEVITNGKTITQKLSVY